MSHTITVKYTGKCAECQSAIGVGAQARYYGRGVLYGITCHPQTGNNRKTDANSSGLKVTRVLQETPDGSISTYGFVDDDLIAKVPPPPVRILIETEPNGAGVLYTEPKPARNGHRKLRDNYGLPGPNPPRNALGGFKVVGLGAIDRSGPAHGTIWKKGQRNMADCGSSPCSHTTVIRDGRLVAA